MPVGCSFGGANRHGEDDAANSTDRPSGRLISGRGHDSHGSKWSTPPRISPSSVGTRIFMATTAIIIATTPTILSTPPWRATGTIIALAGRGEVTTWSQLVKRHTLFLT